LWRFLWLPRGWRSFACDEGESGIASRWLAGWLVGWVAVSRKAMLNPRSTLVNTFLQQKIKEFYSYNNFFCNFAS
jgi:hypothetical protein